MRMERALPTEDTCVLVRGDGHYHVERLRANEKVEIFEDVLSPSDFRTLEETLATSVLTGLSQDNIADPLINLHRDEVVLSTYRTGHWQSLRFPSADSRKPYEQTLHPLLEFLDSMKSTKHSLLREDSARNNCNPPVPLELRTRTTELAPNFVLRATMTRFNGHELDSSCVVVYPKGKYHYEQETQRIGSADAKVKVFEGHVGPEELGGLTGILDDPALKTRPNDSSAGVTMATEGEMAALTIPREGHVQQLDFRKYFSTLRSGSGGMPIIEDNGVKVLRPLQQWIKTNVERGASGSQGSLLPNRCKPEQTQ